MKVGIKVKLIIVFSLLITLPLSVLGGISYFKSKNILKENLQETNAELLKEIEQSIQYYTESFEGIVSQMSKSANVQQVLSNADYKKWIIGDFKGIKESYEDVLNVYIATKDKQVVLYPLADIDSSYEPRSKEWYIDAVKENKTIWSDPYIDKATGKLIITLSAPIYNSYKTNEFVGVFGIDIALETISDNIGSVVIGEKGFPMIIDNQGKVLAHKNKELLMKKLDNEYINKAITEKSTGSLEYSLEENGKNVEYTTVFDKIENLGWTILTVMYTDEISDDTTTILNSIIVVIIISLAIAIFIAVVFSITLTKSIKILLENMEKVKNGELSVRNNIKTKDEIGKLGEVFNAMLESVGSLINNVKEVSKQLSLSSQNLAANSEETSASAEQVNTAIEEIAKGATEQAGDAEKCAQLTYNLSEKLNDLTSNTRDIESSANEATNANLNGTKVVEQLQVKTENNKQAIQKIEHKINELNSNTSSIDTMLDTINSISEQTNLLALNASIEAARAGEAGKGFAVVADEIRKLAEGSQQATDEIKQIITKIKKDSSDTVQVMGEVKDISNDQTIAVDEVNKSFMSISDSVENIIGKIEFMIKFVTDINRDKETIVSSVQNISTISQETAASSEEVNASIQQQSAAIEEVANAADRLNELAENLDKELGKFKVIG
jgi:methyl-accepting chemotaxis protein